MKQGSLLSIKQKSSIVLLGLNVCRTAISDYNMRLILLSMIQLSGGHRIMFETPDLEREKEKKRERERQALGKSRGFDSGLNVKSK